MDLNLNKAQDLLNGGISEAEDIIRNPSRVDEILVDLEEKLKAVPAIGQTLSNLPLMIAMIKAWITKEYTVVSPQVIATLVAAVVYLLKKKDLISDNIPLIGIADDLAVLGLALKLSEPELNAFAEWRASRNA